MESEKGGVLKLSQDELRQLQLIELEMIAEVDRICRKNNIEYSLDGGTLLGAIRHKGFIPWDDDADIIFTRHEYAKFYRACKKDLDKDRFFLQEYRTDPNYRWGYAKIRRNHTEYTKAGQEHMKYHGGICIDVFVADNVPDNYILRRIVFGINTVIRKILYSELGMKSEKTRAARAFYRVLYSTVPRDLMFKIRNKIAGRINKKPTKLRSHLLFTYPNKRAKYGMPSECFDAYTDVLFEGFSFRIFKEYDKYLSVLYGDYMTPPPPEKRVSHMEASKLGLIEVSMEDIRKRYSSHG